MGFFDRWRTRSESTPLRTSQGLDPQQELEVFLKRLSERERASLDQAFSAHAGKITSLRDLDERFDKVEGRLKHAKLTFNESPRWALRQAVWARNHAIAIERIARHLKSFEVHEHERDLARDAITIARYADHAKRRAESLIKQLKPLAR